MLSHIINDWNFHDKPTQDAEFKIFRYQLMEVTEDQYLGPENPKKYREYQVSKYFQKAVRNVSPYHK